MSKDNVWHFENGHEDVFTLADYLDEQANAVNFTFDNDEEADAFMWKAREEFAFFAPRCLYIKDKQNKISLFKFNTAQRYLNAIVEWQLKTKGMVRVIIVKGRQQGISTYAEGRGYHRTIHREAYNTLIMAHRADASSALFDMAKRYHDQLMGDLRPTVGAANGYQLKFSDLDSQYTIATAGGAGAGRSFTAAYFHGSEVAFWPNAAEHASGILQTIPRSDDTEIYLESTADGISNYFYDQWEQAASIGDIDNPDSSGYVRVFIPWYWDDGYRVDPPEGFKLTDEEAKYQWIYQLGLDQMFWRRLKIKEMDNDIRRFQRDYPATAEEAFNASGDSILITGEQVAEAKLNYKMHEHVPNGGVAMGVDVAREGDDATCFVIRQGRVVVHCERMYKAKAYEVAARCIMLRERFSVDHTFIDATGGYGTAVIDSMEQMNQLVNTTGVHFNNKANDDAKFTNVRTEMWWSIKLWLENSASLPPNVDWGRDLCAPQYKFEGDRLRLEKKEEIKKRINRSPDVGDALALTFRHPIMRGNGGREGYETEQV